jgi:phage gpG-like protein
MSVRGDFTGLEDLRRRISAFGEGPTRDAIAKNCAAEALHQVQESFVESRDPYGKPWAPLKSRTGSPLRDTGRFMNSFTAKWSPDSFSVSTNFVGAAVHQYGATITPKNAKMLAFKVRGAPTKSRPRGRASSVFAKSVTIPARQIVPEGDVGPRWHDAIEDAAMVTIMRHMGGDF